MQRSSRRAPAVLLSLSLFACGGPEAPATEEADVSVEHGSPHLLPLSVEGEARKKAGKLLYYGGPVLSQAKVVAVLWGDVAPDVAGGIGDFYSAFVQSSHFKWLSEYDTTGTAVDGSPGTQQHIAAGSFAGAVQISPRAKKKALSSAQIERELAAQVRKGVLPAPDEDTVFMVHFPAGVTIASGGSRSCESGGFCGYHSAFRVRGKRLAYAVLPDMSDGSGCDVGCGSGSPLDRVTTVASHELVESTTDPEVGLASSLAAPLAWYDPAGGEIGDLCNGQQIRVRMGSGTWTIQKQWSNAKRACVAGGR